MKHPNHKHGHNRRGADGRNHPTPTYRSWQAMLNRCRNVGGEKFQEYGARGVTVCRRWLKFENFLADMGVRPAGMTLDRRNNARGYSKSNCRWATRKQQGDNRRTTRWIRFRGERRTTSDWARHLKIGVQTLHARLWAGWSITRAFTAPVRDTGRA